MHSTTRTVPVHRHRPVAAALAVIGCAVAVAVAACGSAGKSGARSSFDATGIRFANCMRAHGVPNFPDPGGGGGIQVPAGSGINPQSPAFQSAQKACSRLLPGGGPGGGQEASETQKLAMLKLSECMRRHGVSTFPDPTTTAPAPGTGFALAFGRPGSFIAIPQSLVQSPGFNQAAAACNLPGAGPGGPKRAVALPG